jgi:glutathione S-transferase
MPPGIGSTRRKRVSRQRNRGSIMADLEILGAPQSNYVWTVRIAAAEKGAPYILIPLRPHSDEIKAVHPLGKIPAMRHGAVALCESKGICTYIDRAFPGPSLISDDPVKAAQTEQWISVVNTSVDPLLMRQYLGAYFFPGTADGKPDRTRIDAALPKMEPMFALLDRTIGDGCLAAKDFTLADAFLLPILYYMQKLPESGAMLAKSKNLPRYIDAMMARKSIRESEPPPRPGS